MEKSCDSSVGGGGGGGGDSTSSSTSSCTNNRDRYLKHLNKISQKISKPTTSTTATTAHNIIRKSTFDDHHHHQPSVPPPQQPQTQSQQQQHQPPVYNINKSDFRDVVQKLTGSPAHERFGTPPPVQPPKPQNSRLQRIRPPPLAQISHRPPPLPNSAAPAPQNTHNPTTSSAVHRQAQPMSPLPPFPSVHAAAESPISAYMRFLQSSMSSVDADAKRYSPLAMVVPPQQNNPPMSPLPFGLLSPSLLFSPTTGRVQSPKWEGV